MLDFTGWRNILNMWGLNKTCNVKAFQCRCEPGILSNCSISCFYRVEEHQNA